MSEFNPPADAKMEPIAAPRVPPKGPGWYERPLVLGLSLPWLLGAGLLMGAASWYLFGPDGKPTVNQLAFHDSGGFEPVTAAPQARSTAELMDNSSADLSQFKEEVATMIGGEHTYAEANRSAIERLAETVKSQGAALTTAQQQVAEDLVQITVLTARLASAEQRPAAVASATPTPKAAKAVSSLSPSLASLHLEAVQNGMAWISWQDKTWAVKAGDQVGPVTINRIDAPAREVITSAGTLK